MASKCFSCGNTYDGWKCPVCAQTGAAKDAAEAGRDAARQVARGNAIAAANFVALQQANAIAGASLEAQARSAAASERAAEAHEYAAQEVARQAAAVRRQQDEYDNAAGAIHAFLLELHELERDGDAAVRWLRLTALTQRSSQLEPTHLHPAQRNDLVRLQAGLRTLSESLDQQLGTARAQLGDWLMLIRSRAAHEAAVGAARHRLETGGTERGFPRGTDPESSEIVAAWLRSAENYAAYWCALLPPPPPAKAQSLYSSIYTTLPVDTSPDVDALGEKAARGRIYLLAESQTFLWGLASVANSSTGRTLTTAGLLLAPVGVGFFLLAMVLWAHRLHKANVSAIRSAARYAQACDLEWSRWSSEATELRTLLHALRAKEHWTRDPSGGARLDALVAWRTDLRELVEHIARSGGER